MSSSPARDKEIEERCKWKQRRIFTTSGTKSQLQTMSAMSSASTTAANTNQYLQRRRSQFTIEKREEQQLQSPRFDQSRRMERKRSSEDSQHFLKQSIPADGDTTVEKLRTSDFIAAGSGKGSTATTGQNPTKLTMAKKRKAPFSSLTGVLVIVVAGGVVVCRVYPSSFVATSIRVAADRVEEALLTLLVNLWNEMEPYTKSLGQELHVKWLSLLSSRRLEKVARAVKMQALQGISGLIQPRKAATVCFRLTKGLRDQLRLGLSGLVDALELSMEWINSGFMKLTEDNELFEQVRALLLTALSCLVEAFRQSEAVTTSSLGRVFEWLGMESKMSDVNLPGEHFLAPLVTHHAALQSIESGLTAQEFRAVHDVKRFEKRRVAIASATNSIIEDTRAFALESVLNVKMAAVEYIEERTRQLAELYARAFEQALEDYERASWQAKEEGGSGMLVELTTESQDAAASVKRYLSVHQKAIDDKLMEAPVLGDQTSSKGELRDERGTGHHLVGSQLAEESKQSGGLTEVSVLKEQSPAKDSPGRNLDNEEESQILFEIASEGVMTVEQREAPAPTYNSLEKASKSELVSEEQAHVLTVEVSEVSVMGRSGLSEKAVEGDHVTEDQLQIIAKHTEIDLLDAALESTDRDEAIDEVTQTFTTQVSVDFDNTLLEVELMQSEVSKLVGVRNQSEEAAKLQQESRVEAHLKASADGTDMTFVKELTAIADTSFEEAEVKQPLANVRTRVTAQTGIVADGNMEKAMMEMTQCIQENCKETLQADGTEIGTQSGQLDTESVRKVQVDVDGIMVFRERQPTEEELASVHSHDEAVVGMEMQKGPAGLAGAAQRERIKYLDIEENAIAATLADDDTLVSAKEILELEELETILLQEDDERIRAKEELRVIAEEERIWLQTDQAPAESGINQKDAVSGQRRTDVTKRAEAVAGLESKDWHMSPASMQIGLFSIAFFGLAALTVYLFVRHRKHRILARSPHRRRRWQRFPDVDESEAEEVVLLPDDSSEEEGDTDVVVAKQSSFKGIGRMASVDAEAIEAISSGGEEDDEQEEIGANHKNVEEKEDTVKEANLDAERSRLVVTERAQTIMYTVDRPVTSNLDALADDDDDTASMQETPDTSQRRREICTYMHEITKKQVA